MMAILNLTQHQATLDQIAAGVYDLPEGCRGSLAEALTFNDLPDREDIERRADFIAKMASATGTDAAMIGGAPWLMGPLAAALRSRGIEPVFAFSKREVEEQAQPDGTVRKVAVFRHAGWVPAA